MTDKSEHLKKPKVSTPVVGGGNGADYTQEQTTPPKKPKTALLIGGGAPNSTLMAGALLAFLEHKVEFDVISCAGAGALMGLIYTAPKNGNPAQALRDWAKVGVNDTINSFFPPNYKVFMKPGEAAGVYRDWLQRNPFTAPFYDVNSPWGTGFFSDWVKLGLATLSPSNLSQSSLGMCAHIPFAEQMVDFDKVPTLKSEFYINAYNLNQEKMTIWGKDEVNLDHLKAAFSFPMIYPPYTIKNPKTNEDEDFIEGAAIDTINFKAIVSDDDTNPGLHTDVETLVIFDILGADKLIRKPRNLFDAWVHSIITPLVEIAKDDIRIFESKYNVDPVTHKPKRKLLKVDLMGGIPSDHWPQVLDWSNSNLELLFDVGYKAGIEFVKKHGHEIGVGTPQAAAAA